jgi:hypothetical protein
MSSETESHLANLETIEAAMDAIKDRMFNKRDPESLQFALDTFAMRHKRKPALVKYWEDLISGLKRNIERHGRKLP